MKGIVKTSSAGVIFLALAFMASCGKKAESPTSVVNRYHQAIIDKDLDTVMSLLAPDANREWAKATMDARSEMMGKLGLPPVLGEKIDGESAVVTCKIGPTEVKLNLSLVNGEWKIK